MGGRTQPELFRPQIENGWIEDSVAEEFPALRLRWACVAGPARRSPAAVRRRLAALSDAIAAPQAVSLRHGPVAEAYRVFGRQIGLDPDADGGPLELALVQRIRHGEFKSAGLPADACLIATVETSVPIWPLDAETLVGALGVCAVQPGELLGRGAKANPVQDGRLTVADLSGPLALVLSEPPPTVAPSRHSDSIVLYALGVDAVPDLVLDEALWMAAVLASETG